MPTYEYRCNGCDNDFEVFQKVGDPNHECVVCGSSDTEKLLSACMGRVKGQPKTVGQQAEINMKKLGKERYDRMMEEASKPKPFTGKLGEGMKAREKPKDDGELPWYRDGHVPGVKKMEKPLDLNKVKNTEKYVMTGET